MAAARPDGPRGRLITVEGVEGAGKSTQVAGLRAWLVERGVSVVATAEPDGTPLGASLRRVLGEVDRVAPLTEALLFAASRAEHVRQVIGPALAAGRVVLCDRYVDSTVAYQGYGRGVALDIVAELNRLATDGVTPELTIVLDLDVAEGLRRVRARQGAAAACDPFERLAIEFHERVRKGYWAIRDREPDRVVLVDADRALPVVAAEIAALVARRLWARAAVTQPSASAVWASIVGQPSAVALLQRAIAQDRLAHAYAFVGPSGVGRRLTAIAFAQAALCSDRGCGTCATCRRVAAGQFTDCQVVAPTPPPGNPKGVPTIRIEQIRELERTAALAPHEGSRKVFVLDEAERMTLPTAQALLKTLEEPPPRTHLVLIIANPLALPPTVLSRCQRVRFRPLGDAEAARLLEARGIPPAASGLLARLAQGRPGLALGLDLDTLRARREAALALLAEPLPRLGVALDAAATDRQTVAAYLEFYWSWYRDALCLAAGGSATLLVHVDQEAVLRALAARVPAPALTAALGRVKAAWVALDNNLNPRLALETALLGAGAAAA